MFRSARWRSEKNKIKAVFKLQFQATQVPQLKGKTLMISLVPAYVGKPTVRLQKVAIVEGTCSWENPIYETVKFVRDSKTGRFKESIYYFIISTGSSKSGFLGEVSLDFADFAEATKPLLVSLPLNNSNSGAILHVGIQKIQGTDDPRDAGGNEAPITESLDGSLQNQLGDCNTFGNGNLNCMEDEHYNQITSAGVEPNKSFRDPQLDNPNIPKDFAPTRWNPIPLKKTVDDVQTEHVHWRSETYLSVGSASDRSMVDSANSPENFTRDVMLEASNDSIEMLKNEISIWERQAAVSELELQSLRKQIVKESRRGQELSKEIASLKEERNALKTEYEQLKSYKKHIHEAEPETKELKDISEDIRKELKHQKDLNKKMRLRLHKTEDSNSELILVVNDLNKKVEQKYMEISHLSSTIKAIQHENGDDTKSSKYNTNQNKDELALEELNCEDKNAKEAELLGQNIRDLLAEIEVYRKDKEELKMHIEQLDMEYAKLKQENHNILATLEKNQTEKMKMQSEYSDSLANIKELKYQIDILEKTIKKQDLEFTETLNTINELKAQVKSLEKELEEQARNFEDDLEAVTQAKLEQEKRAIQAEEALRKTRWSNANAAERLQDEFRRLSVDMASKFDENERKFNIAVKEANDLHLQKTALEEMLQKANEELGLLKDQYKGKVQGLSDQINLQAKQIEKMTQGLEDKHNQVENFQKHEEENHKGFSSEIQRLKGEIESHRFEKSDHHAEGKQEAKVESEMEQSWDEEREHLRRELSSGTKEVEILKDKLRTVGILKDEKEILAVTLQSGFKRLSIQYDQLKLCMLKIESENETLRKQVFKLEGDLKKEVIVAGMDNTIESKGEHAAHSDIKGMTFKDAISALLPYTAKNTISLTEKKKSLEEARHATEIRIHASKLEERESKGENMHEQDMKTTEGTTRQNEVLRAAVKREMETFSDKALLSTCETIDNSDINKLLSEVTSLKERNKHMESDLKEMQEKYSEISVKFAEVEGERQQLVMSLRNLKNGKKR